MCKNCGTKSTPFWRKDKNDGRPLCNACGLYFSKNDAPRPKVLWKQDEGGGAAAAAAAAAAAVSTVTGRRGQGEPTEHSCSSIHGIFPVQHYAPKQSCRADSAYVPPCTCDSVSPRRPTRFPRFTRVPPCLTLRNRARVGAAPTGVGPPCRHPIHS